MNGLGQNLDGMELENNKTKDSAFFLKNNTLLDSDNDNSTCTNTTTTNNTNNNNNNNNNNNITTTNNNNTTTNNNNNSNNNNHKNNSNAWFKSRTINVVNKPRYKKTYNMFEEITKGYQNNNDNNDDNATSTGNVPTTNNSNNNSKKYGNNNNSSNNNNSNNSGNNYLSLKEKYSMSKVKKLVKKNTEINELPLEELKALLTKGHELNLHRLLQSLYDDRILPLVVNVKGRADEYHFNDILKNNIKNAYSLFPEKYVIKNDNECSNDYVIYFIDKKIDPDYFSFANSLKDTYDPSIWIEFEKYLNEIAKSEDENLYTFSGGRYGMAKELQNRNLPFFKGLYLGELCHIVHLSTNKKIIAYENNLLKPISQCYKYRNAKLGIVSPNNEKNLENYITTMKELKYYMNMLLKYYKGGFNISTLKKKLKHKFNKQLCESAFHCIKLIEVLELDEMKDVCIVDKESKMVRSTNYA
ncbi:conserved protein, unknown function [Hepatocystis sp. ex Piliocolobus tephrosceles]|nr:conserved protein, unknown function [Hepatocystis sp. ex Piliocolobus tephrosceles]